MRQMETLVPVDEMLAWAYITHRRHIAVGGHCGADRQRDRQRGEARSSPRAPHAAATAAAHAGTTAGPRNARSITKGEIKLFSSGKGNPTVS